MIAGTVHGAHSVGASGQPVINGCSEQAVAIAGVIDALEKGKLGRVERVGRRHGAAHVLDDDVGVADDVAAAVEVLRRGVVGCLRVGEGAGFQVGCLHFDVEGLVCGYVFAGLGVDDDGRHHLGLRWDFAHYWMLLVGMMGGCFWGVRTDAVAGAALHLSAVCQGVSFAEVDEVVIAPVDGQSRCVVFL